MKTKKIIAVVDWKQQTIEKNQSPYDYPMYNYVTGRKLKKWFSKYYSSWKNYCTQIEPSQYEYCADNIRKIINNEII